MKFINSLLNVVNKLLKDGYSTYRSKQKIKKSIKQSMIFPIFSKTNF